MLYLLLLLAALVSISNGFTISKSNSLHIYKNNLKIFQSTSDILSNHNHILIITKDKSNREEFIKSIMPSSISSKSRYDLFDVKNLIELEKNTINDIVLQKKTIYIMFEDDILITDEVEKIRQQCTYTLFIPSLESKSNDKSNSHKYYQSMDILLNLCKQRLQKMLINSNSITNKSSEILLQAGEWSHFLSLTFNDVELAMPILSKLRIGIDAVELRIDLLKDISIQSLHRQISLLKDFLQLPIVFTVRTKSQIGKYPDDATSEIKELLLEGMRAGAEWIDIEGCLPKNIIHDLTYQAKNKYSGTSKLLGSLHVTIPQSVEQIQNMYELCDLDGEADMLKVVTGAESLIDCQNVHTIGKRQHKPYIGLCLGEKGSYSRVMNRRYTPVTHELMAAAAPGQLTVNQLMDIRQKDELCMPKKFYLFGTPIQQSLSPSMHNNAYQALLLPHKYSLCEEQDVESYRKVFEDPAFGGASVTIPHKETIMPLLDEVRGAAVAIGAVNTVVPVTDPITNLRKLIGYNTDWIGMRRPISRLLNEKLNDKSTKKGIGLVVGAGGTARAACYAIKDLGLDLYITNRTPDKAKELANRFQGIFTEIEKLHQLMLENDLELHVVISTVPASANFILPKELLITKQTQDDDDQLIKPIILDVVYKPAKTSLLSQAIEYKCPYIIQGATMLLEQGIEQFELWNHRTAPRNEMTNAIFSGVEKLN